MVDHVHDFLGPEAPVGSRGDIQEVATFNNNAGPPIVARNKSKPAFNAGVGAVQMGSVDREPQEPEFMHGG
jgi:hypothetical protein